MTVTDHRESELAGAGGVKIYWQAWSPLGRPRAVVVIAHGVSEHSGRYGYVAERLVREGYAVYALDHRGHGRSGGPRPVQRRDQPVDPNNPQTWGKVQRNAPCPCGSGRKFKHCHGALV